jgi:hypothetical protein
MKFGYADILILSNQSINLDQNEYGMAKMTRFVATKPGLVFIKEIPASTEEKTIKIMKNQGTMHFEGMPLVLNPKGLAAERA